MSPSPSRFPVVTAVVLALLVAAMVGLGVWQLARGRAKDAAVARYTAAQGLPPIAWPAVPPGDDRLLFRRASVFCLEPLGWRTVAGASRDGRPGWHYIAACRTGAEGPGVSVDAGWAPGFDRKPSWRGGKVTGVIGAVPGGRSLLATLTAPRRATSLVLVAEQPVAGLEAGALPSVAEIPNNHRAYAVQWFVFAAIALVIAALAWRRQRLR